MAITISKTKQAKVKDEVVEQDKQATLELSEMSAEQLADEYGSLDDQIRALMDDPRFIRFEKVKAELQSRLLEFEPTDELSIEGDHWELEVSACSTKPRSIVEGAQPQIFKMMGNEMAYKLCKFTISDLEKYLTPEQVTQVLKDNGFSTNRKIKVKYLG